VKRLDLAEAAWTEAEKIAGPIRFVVLRGETDADTVVAMLNAADCLLMASDYEGSPTIVQEAMACNLPVVSVDVGDVRERLEGVVPSRIVARDPVEIGRAIAEMAARGVRSNGALAAVAISLDTLRTDLLGVYRSAAGKE
jgi:teichuronic acid biosynthesis glycosyltransferase TuaC